MSLTEGALGRIITHGENVTDPIVQVLCCKAVQSGEKERFRLFLSDGAYCNSFSMLGQQKNNLVHEKKLEPYTIIKITNYTCNLVQGTKKIMYVCDLEVVKPGSEVGKKIGNPINIMGDGNPQKDAQSQNKDPNSGAVKRPGDSANSGPPLKQSYNDRSSGTPKPSLNRQSYGGGGMDAGGPTVAISGITPYQNKWTLKARVTSKSDIRTWNKSSGSGKLFSLDLMDDSGEIRATAFNDQCDKYYDMIQVGKVYRISRCSVKAANKAYSKLNNDYELTFKDNVLVEPVEESESSEVPTMSYNFAKISELSNATKDSFVDTIGVCKASNDIVNITTRAGKELMKREVVLVDDSDTEITLTLWGTTASNFDGAGAPVVAVKNAKVSDFNGVTISGGDVLVNPEMKETHALKGWWDTKGKNMEFSSLTVQGQRGAGSMDAGSLKTLSDVKFENMGHNSDRGDYYSTIAYTTFFSKDKALYKACPNMVDGRECNKKVSDSGDGTYRCEKCCTDLDNFKWRLMLSLSLGDCTDSVWASCFQESAEKLLGRSSEEVGQLSESDEQAYGAIFAEACFRPYNFRMRAKADTYNDETRVKHVVMSAEPVNYQQLCKQRIKEIEALGGTIPDSIDRSLYQ